MSTELNGPKLFSLQRLIRYCFVIIYYNGDEELIFYSYEYIMYSSSFKISKFKCSYSSIHCRLLGGAPVSITRPVILAGGDSFVLKIPEVLKTYFTEKIVNSIRILY